MYFVFLFKTFYFISYFLFLANFFLFLYHGYHTIEAQAINMVSYLNLLKETFHDDTHPDEWFQQDGATAHTAGEVMDWLKRRFPGRLIFHRSKYQLPHMSLDLSPLDFYLWGFVKERVFRPGPANIRELKVVVRYNSIYRGQHASKRGGQLLPTINKCTMANEGHFEE